MDPKSITGEDEVMWVKRRGNSRGRSGIIRVVTSRVQAALGGGGGGKKKKKPKKTHTHIPPITTLRWALTSLLRTKGQIDIRYSKQQRTFSKQSVFWCLQIERD
jgi:hypothetical protein